MGWTKNVHLFILATSMWKIYMTYTVYYLKVQVKHKCQKNNLQVDRTINWDLCYNGAVGRNYVQCDFVLDDIRPTLCPCLYLIFKILQ